MDKIIYKFSIVIPVFCEEKNLPEFFERLLSVIKRIDVSNISFEIIVNDNASYDDSWKIIKAYASANPIIRAHRFVRNYGFQNSILYGLSQSQGDAAIVIQSDLQEPPEIIEELIKAYMKKKSRIILAVPKSRQGSKLTKLLRSMMHSLFFKITDLKTIKHAQDFYLIDRSVIEELKYHPYSSQFLRGKIIQQFSNSDQIISYAKLARTQGSSSFNFIRLYSLAMDAFLAYGSKILRILTLGSVLILIVMLVAVVLVIILWFFNIRFPVTGYTSLVVILMFIAIILLLSFSIVIEYLYRIYNSIFSPTTIVTHEKIN